MSSEPQPHKASRFKESALHAFRFLPENYALTCVEADSCGVRYESKTMFVTVSYDPRSHEVSALVGLRNDQDAWVYVDEIASIGGEDPREKLGDRQAADEAVVVILVNELARLLREHGSMALRGDRVFFQGVKERHAREALDYTRSLQLRSALTKTTEAWARKDYRAVVKELTPFQEWLSDGEAKRLKYARQKLAS